MKSVQRTLVRLFFLALLLLPLRAGARKHVETDSLVGLAMQYGQAIAASSPDSLILNVYEIGHVSMPRRNFTLVSVPTMFYAMRDSMRESLWERYGRLTYRHEGKSSASTQLLLSTVRHRKRLMTNQTGFAMPTFYQANLFSEGVLSPLCAENRRHYRYSARTISDSTAQIDVRDRINSTQLVRKGKFIIDSHSGRLLDFEMEIEFDMFHFTLFGQMDAEGRMPSMCHIVGRFHYLGNHVDSDIRVHYGLPVSLPDTLRAEPDLALMDQLRPEPLDSAQSAIAEMFFISHPDTKNPDSVDVEKEKHQRRNKFWNVVGDNLLNRIHAEISDRGNISIAPIFNPLYFGYSKRKGIVYKFAIRGNFRLNDWSSLSMNAHAGYSFKQKQLYFSIPISYNINRRHRAALFFEVANGNRITDASVLRDVEATNRGDTIDWSKKNLDYFKSLTITAGVRYGVLKHYLDLEVGALGRRRTAVDKEGFHQAGKPTRYNSFAPYMQLSYWPLGRRYPWIATLHYEHGMHTMGGRIEYQKMEVDTQYKLLLSRLRTLSLRVGGGGFMNRNRNDYFVEYCNFRQENIPGGWNDDWSGNFELLNSNWYNASDYYLRFNATYESPLLLLSWIPWVGRAMEQERIYLSMVTLNSLHAYTEIGYGFTNRLFSLGVFVGGSPHYFEGVGLKVGLELFNGW